MKTPEMIHDTETWLMTNVAKAIYNGWTIPTAASNLGVSREKIAEYYMKVMVKCSLRAIHELYGKVRVFTDHREHWFILHPVDNKITGYEKVGYDKWKCAPDMEELKKVPSHLRKA